MGLRAESESTRLISIMTHQVLVGAEVDARLPPLLQPAHTHERMHTHGEGEEVVQPSQGRQLQARMWVHAERV